MQFDAAAPAAAQSQHQSDATESDATRSVSVGSSQLRTASDAGVSQPSSVLNADPMAVRAC